MSEAKDAHVEMPPMNDDQLEDAAFRAKDRAWVALARLFDSRSRNQGLTYAQLGKRIGRSRAHVQRWLASPFNLSLKSLGLLAEALDAELVIDVRPRLRFERSNYCHPSEDAKAAAHNRPVGSFVQVSDPVATSNAIEVNFRTSNVELADA